MKRLLPIIALVLLFNFTSFSQTSCPLPAGAIQIISVDTDGSNDIFCFMALQDIDAGVDINFTDNGWLAAGGFRANEGVVTFTTPAGGLACGDINCLAASGNFNLSASGDQVIAFCGTVGAPTLIAGVNLDGTGAGPGLWNADATNSNTSAAPAGVPAANAIAFGEIDNIAFNCTDVEPGADCATLTAAVTDPTQYLLNNTTPFSPSYTDCPAVLPVELISFEITKVNKEAISLKWEVATELNTFEYIIEKSVDGEKFETISILTAMGSNRSYHFEDENPNEGRSYYRLKMIDYDGSFEYSDIKTANLAESKSLSIYPTKAKSQITIAYTAETNQLSEVSIFNIQGQKVNELALDLNANAQIDINQLASGTYILQVRIGEDIFTERFIKE